MNPLTQFARACRTINSHRTRTAARIMWKYQDDLDLIHMIGLPAIYSAARIVHEATPAERPKLRRAYNRMVDAYSAMCHECPISRENAVDEIRREITKAHEQKEAVS